MQSPIQTNKQTKNHSLNLNLFKLIFNSLSLSHTLFFLKIDFCIFYGQMYPIVLYKYTRKWWNRFDMTYDYILIWVIKVTYMIFLFDFEESAISRSSIAFLIVCVFKLNSGGAVSSYVFNKHQKLEIRNSNSETKTTEVIETKLLTSPIENNTNQISRW